jgi:hypothetical protein
MLLLAVAIDVANKVEIARMANVFNFMCFLLENYLKIAVI